MLIRLIGFLRWIELSAALLLFIVFLSPTLVRFVIALNILYPHQ